MAKGIIKRYDPRKGFGFITDDKNNNSIFFHKSKWQGDGPIREGLAVEFVDKDSEKGPQAEYVLPLDGNSSKSPKNKKTAVKAASLEDRVASLESSIGIWKTLSFLAFAGVVILAVEKFIL